MLPAWQSEISSRNERGFKVGTCHCRTLGESLARDVTTSAISWPTSSQERTVAAPDDKA